MPALLSSCTQLSPVQVEIQINIQKVLFNVWTTQNRQRPSPNELVQYPIKSANANAGVKKLPHPLNRTKSKRTAAFFREPFPYVKFMSKCLYEICIFF